jgi:long-chain acyl-CoA synthetase
VAIDQVLAGFAPLSTLQDVLVGLNRWPNETAIIAFRDGTKEAVTYGELENLARRLAAGLIAHGVAVGEPVGIYADSRPEAVALRLALIAAGAMMVSIDQDLTPEQLAHVLEDSGCRRIFTLSGDRPRVRQSCGETLEIFLLDEETNETESAKGWKSLLLNQTPDPRLVAPEDIAALFYTSGTTGPPKGVPLSHGSIAFNLRALLGLNVVAPGDRVLLPLPLHHSYPFIVGMLTPLAAGAAMVLPSEVTGPAMQIALRDAGPTIMIGVPRLYEALYAGVEGRIAARGTLPLKLFRLLLQLSRRAQRRFGPSAGRHLFAAVHRNLAPNLRVLVSGGARLDPEIGRRLEALGWQVLSGYGLVETASISTFNPPGRARMESGGLPAPEVDVRVDQPDAAGRGEVLIKGPNVFRGYKNNPDANRLAFTDDGWFRSGDLGVRDEDGYLYIVGRVKEMIVLPDGKNIAPENVEALYQKIPYVHEIAVVERAGALAGLVVPDLEAVRTAGSARIDDLIRVSFAELAPQLPPYQRLSDFAITREELPRTRLGKYQRHHLPEIYERAERRESPAPTPLSDSDRELLESLRIAPLWAWLERRFEGRVLTPGTSPQLELGIDSLAWVTLGLEIEERFGFHLTEEALARVITLRDLLEAVQALPETPKPAEATSLEARRRLPAESESWLSPTGPWLVGLGRVLHLVARFVAKAGFRLRVEGLQGVPTSGPLIIASNHASDLDPFMIGAALSFAHMRESYWGADLERAFSHPVLGRLARALHLFPVDDRAPAASLEMGTAVLERSRILIWFPEEWRSPTGELQRFLPGVAHLAIKTGAPIVPAYIAGTFEAMPRTRRIPRLSPVRVVFGAPLSADGLEAKGHGEGREERICTALRDTVAALVELRRGCRGDSSSFGKN